MILYVSRTIAVRLIEMITGVLFLKNRISLYWRNMHTPQIVDYRLSDNYNYNYNYNYNLNHTYYICIYNGRLFRIPGRWFAE
jgi:hypothetical protein